MTSHDRRRRAVVAGHTGDVETALELFADPEPSVRVPALGALARCGALDTAVTATAVTDPHETVRARLAELLADPEVPAGDTDGTTLSDTLGALLRDEHPAAVEPASFAAGERYGMDADVDPPPAIAAALRSVATHHEDPLCREAAVAALGSWGRADDLDVILDATTSKPALRRRAAVALAAHLDDRRALEALRRLTEDRDWQVREVAEVLLDGIDPVTP